MSRDQSSTQFVRAPRRPRDRPPTERRVLRAATRGARRNPLCTRARAAPKGTHGACLCRDGTAPVAAMHLGRGLQVVIAQEKIDRYLSIPGKHLRSNKTEAATNRRLQRIYCTLHSPRGTSKRVQSPLLVLLPGCLHGAPHTCVDVLLRHDLSTLPLISTSNFEGKLFGV